MYCMPNVKNGHLLETDIDSVAKIMQYISISLCAEIKKMRKFAIGFEKEEKMKKGVYLYIISILTVAVIGCSGGGNRGNERMPHPSDTLYTADAAMEVFDQDPERALAIIDSGVTVGNIEDELATLLRAKVYIQSTSMLQPDTARQMLESLLEKPFVTENPGNHKIVLDLLIQISRLRDDYEQWLRWSTEKADLCRQQGDETEVLRTEAEIGVILTYLGEVDKGLPKLDGVIDALDGQRHFNEMDACIIALKRKISVLKKYDRPAEVIPVAQRIVEKLDDYRQHPDEYADGSYRMPTTDEERSDYCDYYTAQAYSFLARAYAEEGKRDTARYYLTLYERSDYGQSSSGRMVIAPTWCLLGDYGKMTAIYDEVSAQMGSDTINLDYANMLRDRAIAAKATGNTAASSGYWQRYADLKDLLNKQLQESKAHEYAARYQLQEERLITEREEAAKKRMGVIATLLGIMLFVVATFVFFLMRQLHSIREKNAVLAKEITDKIENEEKYLVAIKRQADKQHDTTSGIDPSALTDSELFEQIRRFILEEKLYLDPQFGRQQLIDRLHLSKESIGAAFSKGSQYTSLASFVNEMRLIHGAKLLVENPKMSITDVATASGFASNITFSHNFKERYALTPSNFREGRIAQLPQ